MAKKRGRVKSKTTKKVIETAARRQFTIELRKSGIKYETIVEQVIARFGIENLPKGYDVRYAYKDVKRELDMLHAEIAEGIEDIRTMELERLDRMFVEVYRQALQGVLGAVDRCLAIQRQRERYIPGLKAPEQLEIGAIGGGPISVREVVIREPDDSDDS